MNLLLSLINKKHIFLFLLIAVFFFILPKSASAAACNATSDGTWGGTDTANFSGCTGAASGGSGTGNRPGSNDDLTIDNGVNLTLSTDATILSLTFTGPGTDNDLTHSTGADLIVTNGVTINQGTGTNDNAVWFINAGTGTVGGTLNLAGTSVTNGASSDVTITTGTLSANGGITCGNGEADNHTITVSGTAGTINMKGALTTNNGCTLTSSGSGSIFNYNDNSSAQTVDVSWGGGTYNNLYLNNTSASGATLGAAITSAEVVGDIRVQTGTLKNGGFDITCQAGADTFEVSSGATFVMSGTDSTPFPSTCAISLGATSTTSYTHTSAATVSSQTYGHLSIAPASGSVTFTLGGATTVAGNLTLSTGASLDTSNGNNYGINLAGNWINSGTAFTARSGTVTLDGSSTQDIQGSTTTSFNNLTVTNSSAEITATTDFNVSGTLNINHASAVVNIGSSRTINSGGAGTSTLTGTGTVKVSKTNGTSDFENQYVFNTYTLTNLTVNYTGTGQTLSGGLTYNNVTVSGTIDAQETSTTATINGALNVSGTFDPNAETVSFAADGWTLAGAGTLNFKNLTITEDPTTQPSRNFTVEGTLTVNNPENFAPTGTVTMDTTAWAITNNGTLTFTGLTIAETPSSQPTSSFSVAGTLTVNGSKTLAPTAGTITVNGGGAISNSGTLTFNNLTTSCSSTSVTANTSFTVNGALTNGSTCTLAPASGTITMATTGWSIVNSGTLTFNNLTVSETPSAQSTSSYTVGGTLTVNSGKTLAPGGGTITFNDGSSISNSAGTLTFSSLTLASSATVSVSAGTFTVGGSFTANSGSTMNFTSTSAQTIPGLTYVNLGAGNGTTNDPNAVTYTLGGNTVVSGVLTVGDSDSLAADTLDASTRTLTLSGTNGDPFVITATWGAFSESTSTVEYTGDNTGGNTTVQTETYHHLNLGGGSAETYVPEGAVVVSNDLTINANGTLSGSQAVTVNDDLVVTGTLSGTQNVTVNGTPSGAGTVNLTGGTFEQIVAAAENFGSTSGSNNWTFNNLKFNNSSGGSKTITTASGGTGSIIISGTLTLGDGGSSTVVLDNDTNDRTIDADGAVTVGSNGSFTSSSSTPLTIAGSFTNSGTFTHSNGTVNFDGGSQTFTGNTTFYDLLITGTSARTVTFTAGSTQSVASGGSLIFSGASGQLLTLQSSAGSDWNLQVANDASTDVAVSYVSVSRSNASGYKTIVAYDGTNTNGGNNTNWVFAPAPTNSNFQSGSEIRGGTRIGN